MTNLEIAIKESLEAIGVSWCPAMNTQAGVIINDADASFPICVQVIEDEDELLDSGYTLQTVKFYMTEEKGKEEDVLVVMGIFEKVDLLIDLFVAQLKKRFECESVGKRQKALDTFPTLEAGKSFSLNIKYMKC